MSPVSQSSPTSDVFQDIWLERQRQDNLWGTQDHDDGVWSLILSEEVGEAAQQALRLLFSSSRTVAAAELRKELIQVAAVAVAWAEAIDRRGSS